MASDEVVDRLRVLPAAADVWLVLITLLYAFGKPIPWWAWLMLGLELALAVAIGIGRRIRA